MRTASLGRVTVELLVGDIADQPGFGAIVNAANAELRTGGGVAGALHHAAGPGLAREAAAFAPIRPGEAVITGGHRLPNAHVIHCLGPVYGLDEPADRLLAMCYSGALRLAEQHDLGSIAFPAISTGAFGYPLDDAADIALRTVASMADGLRSVRRVRFVLYDTVSFAAHDRALDGVLGARG
jgi:O-acetyl-ADP-ribose deacetylase